MLFRVYRWGDREARQCVDSSLIALSFTLFKTFLNQQIQSRDDHLNLNLEYIMVGKQKYVIPLDVEDDEEDIQYEQDFKDEAIEDEVDANQNYSSEDMDNDPDDG